MLIEHISNPWVKFKVLFTTLRVKEKKIQMAKDAFLYVITNYNAFNSQKTEMLDDIVRTYPKVVGVINDKEIFEHFLSFYSEMFERREIVSPSELDWVNKYIGNAEIRIKIEEFIYYKLLRVSSYWDGVRQGFNWTISKKDELELARKALQNRNVGSKRKMEIAQEFGEPDDKFVNAYYKKLLYDKHYNKADNLKVSDPGIVIDVIILNINAEHFQDAVDVARRFLPDNKGIIKETQQIVSILSI